MCIFKYTKDKCNSEVLRDLLRTNRASIPLKEKNKKLYILIRLIILIYNFNLDIIV